ncbi:uncharacterized protein FA14DRAFT_158432 [Meira miltonrushii]|uniref:Uncharacterized protein n=1 Tax=Meira miltonrushii TaxID=1280837 RepID=A0A316V233_9BASI|nr:uncharacterized protein FA14DRAFT_158432 [Meira miltonrushii]PWN31619.1 hypothetical protein FA14DRAFT_158432 [Meira miltonrushii]
MFKLARISFFCLIATSLVLALPLDKPGSQNRRVKLPTSQHVAEGSAKSKSARLSSIAYACVQGVNLCKQASRRMSKIVHDIGTTVGPDKDLNRLRAEYDKLKLNIHKIDYNANKLAREEVQRAKSIKRIL